MTLNDLGEKKTYIKEMIIIEYLRESFDGIEDIKLNSKYSKILNKNPEIKNSLKVLLEIHILDLKIHGIQQIFI